MHCLKIHWLLENTISLTIFIEIKSQWEKIIECNLIQRKDFIKTNNKNSFFEAQRSWIFNLKVHYASFLGECSSW